MSDDVRARVKRLALGFVCWWMLFTALMMMGNEFAVWIPVALCVLIIIANSRN